ncbi:adenine-specific DNA-methyltransferase [Deinococcus reticulitermitis]|uniref:Adenine-specific DNA-methyltransferase n=2 Tax=Deinococcus reticulitermitis TaxID=856736 RepID=A0A1H6V2L5_9DEIO|nr:adenine-specific DNA-methyltransferase [Deinococcus reticulitermitis]
MGRRWIMVELGEHAHTHIIPRLKKVIDGTDQGGISQAVGWQGGGGFQYFKLAPSLLKKDRWGQYVVNTQYNAEMLAEACCKIEGFTFDPSQNPQFYWMHGRSTERDFIYVTTNYLTYAQLVEISEEVGPERSLLILTTAFDSAGETLENLTLKKIPQSLLRRCDWDHDDYSLNVANLPQATAPDERAPEPKPVAAGGRGRKKAAQAGPGLFGDADGGEG